ncbi:MAG: ferric reductase-like transmembrane domain-containing protein [Rhodospirillales bacterium]
MKTGVGLTVGFIVLLAALWLLADGQALFSPDQRSFRHGIVQLSGMLAIGSMCFAVVLAARPKWLEPALDGLDKMYWLHKWIGVTALVFATLHWWYAEGRHLFAGGGGGGGGGPSPGAAAGAAGASPGPARTLSLFADQIGVAKQVGEWAFYTAVVLILIALIKKIPYRLFAITHVLMTAVFLALVYHALVLVRPAYWMQPIGWAMAVTLVAGVAAAAVVLARRLGVRAGVDGVVTAQTWYPELRVLETHIRLAEGWPGHEPGQFAFLTTRAWEGAHPFTIASAWNTTDRTLMFIAKELGDYTARLRDEFAPGCKVKVEGPHGCFNFEDGRPSQIWVGAGVGITPFVARMKLLAMVESTQVIHLFHSTADVSDRALGKLRADADAAGVHLHITVTSRDPHLSGETIRRLVPDWPSASLWFCGPLKFGNALKRDFVAKGMPAADFHQERFAMR